MDGLLFKNNKVARGSQGFVGSGVRAKSLRVGSENTPNFVTFWPTLKFKDDQEKIQVVITSLMTLKVHHV